MSDQAVLQENRRDASETLPLPRRAPDRLWGGRGDGTDCAVCHAPVGPDEVEYEVEFDRNGGDLGVDRFHVHVRCLAPWISSVSLT